MGESYPRLPDGRWISNRPQVVEAGRLLVAPTRTGSGIGEELGGKPGPGSESVAATFLDPATGEVVQQVVVGDTLYYADFGSSVAVSPDRSMVAITWGLGTTVLDTRTRDVIAEIVLPPEEGLPLPAAAVWCAAWTPDGSNLLLGAESADVKRRILLSPNDLLGNLAFSPDGRLLAGGGIEGVLYVLDTTTSETVWEPVKAHDDWLLQTEWLADGRTVVTTGRDGTVSLFDTERGLVRGRPPRASGEPGEGYAHIAPGAENELVVLDGNRTGRRYPLDASVWLRESCAIAGGEDLTAAEWASYLPGRDREPTCSDLS